MPKVEKGGAVAATAKVDKAKQAELAKKEKEAAAKAKAKEKEDIAKAKAKEKADAAKAKAKAAAEEVKKKKEEEKAAKKVEREKASAERKAAKEAAKNKEPEYVTQLNAKGEEELVDKNKFPFEVACVVCGSVRYVTKSGLLLVDKCKLHAKQARRKNRAAKVRNKMKKAKLIVSDALAQGLFPEAFKKKYGLT